MQRLRWISFTFAAATLAAGCGDSAEPPTASLFGGGSSLAQHNSGSAPHHRVTMMDACDPTTFNEVLGEGACSRRGGVTFGNFIAQLERSGTSPSWRFAPSMINARVGDTIVAVNRGGETHTYTQVAEFGGGFVEELNTLSGNPDPAPECLDVPNLEFVPPGGTTETGVTDAGEGRYMCCIHPWMRAVVRAR